MSVSSPKRIDSLLLVVSEPGTFFDHSCNAGSIEWRQAFALSDTGDDARVGSFRVRAIGRCAGRSLP